MVVKLDSLKLDLPNSRATSELARMSAAALPAASALARMQEETRALKDRIRPATDAMRENFATARISQQIADQFKAIGALREPGHFGSVEPPHIRPLPVIRNPIHETNKLLGEIQARFDRMEAIAVESASIATSLQASAVDLLTKFEKASGDNDRATKGVIRLGFVAVVLAIIMPLAQIIHTEYWRSPSDNIATQAMIAEIKSEIAGLRQTQATVGDRLSNALAESNTDATSTLKEIRDLLAKRQGESAK